MKFKSIGLRFTANNISHKKKGGSYEGKKSMV